MNPNGRLVRILVCALLCVGLAGCGDESKDDSAAANPDPVPTPVARGWTVQNYGGISCNSVSAVDANHAWAGGFNLTRTENGGATWAYTDNYFIFKVQFFDLQKGWGGEWGAVYFTSDGGATWEFRLWTKGAATDDALRDFSFVSVATGWVAIGTTLLKTTDSGQTWTTTDLGRKVLAVKFVSEQVGWVTAQDAILPDGVYRNVIMKTTDGGATWEDQFFFTGDGAFLQSISAVDADHAWVGGKVTDVPGVYPQSAVLLATADGGATWTRQAEDLKGYRKVFFLNANVGWLLTTFNIYRSTDGGTTWTNQEYPSDFVYQMLNPFSGFLDVFFVDENNGWVVGDNAIILHTSTGGEK